MKNPDWVSFSPAFHWTDQKLRVHAFYGVLALMLSALLQRKAAKANIRLSIPSLYEQLSEIEEIINLYPPKSKSKRGRLRAEYMLSECTPLQDKLCQAFDVYKLANN
jgi:hypothetical protein